jgi:hypothetical protein
VRTAATSVPTASGDLRAVVSDPGSDPLSVLAAQRAYAGRPWFALACDIDDDPGLAPAGGIKSIAEPCR